MSQRKYVRICRINPETNTECAEAQEDGVYYDKTHVFEGENIRVSPYEHDDAAPFDSGVLVEVPEEIVEVVPEVITEVPAVVPEVITEVPVVPEVITEVPVVVPGVVEEVPVVVPETVAPIFVEKVELLPDPVNVFNEKMRDIMKERNQKIEGITEEVIPVEEITVNLARVKLPRSSRVRGPSARRF